MLANIIKRHTHMKKILTTVMLLSITISLFGQNDDGKKVELQFKKRVSFFAVDDQYNLQKDTIYYADDGFRVFSGYDIEKLEDGKEWVIFRYPNWTVKSQTREIIYPQQEKILLDTVFLKSVKGKFDSDTLREKIYKEILDSLNTLALKELSKRPFRVSIVGRNNLKIAIPKEEFQKLELLGLVTDVYSLKWGHSTKLATGFLTVPFKLRPAQDSVNFNMTTDITLGAYIGIKKRISRQNNYFIVLPATLGLSYINVGNNQTSNVNTANNSSVIPGWSWSSGLMFDLNGFNVGIVFGRDYASGVGKDWLYNGKTWYSFSIGYSFLNKSDK